MWKLIYNFLIFPFVLIFFQSTIYAQYSFYDTDTVREAAGKGLRSAVGLQGISLLPEVPELIEATPELFEQAGGAVSEINELGQYLNEQKANEEGNSNQHF